MTETELERLRNELANRYRDFQKENAVLEKQAKKRDGFFRGDKRRAQAVEKQKALQELMAATENFQKTIERGSTATVEEQENAYKELKKLEDKYNFKGTNSKFNINRPLYNTLIAHHNRSVKQNVEHPVLAFIKKSAIALIPFAAVAILPAIGLGAIGGALATPLAWAGVALAGRSVVHAVQGIARKTVLRNVKKSNPGATYDSIYPTQSNVKGFFRTLGYNRSIKKTAGNMFSSLNEMNEFKNFKGTAFAPVRSDSADDTKDDDKDKDKEKEKEKEKAKSMEPTVEEFFTRVAATDLSDLETLKKLNNELAELLKYATEVNKERLILTVKYFKIAKALHDKKTDAEFGRLVKDLLNVVPENGEKYEELRSKYESNIRALCLALGYDADFIKSTFGEEKGKGTSGGPAPGSTRDPDPAPKPVGGDPDKKDPDPAPTYDDEESYARTPELMMLLNDLRNFNTSKFTAQNYNLANRIIAKVDGAKRIHPKDFHLDSDDEMKLAEIRSVADAYESKSRLLEKLSVCEAAMNAKAFYKEAFEDCIKEFYTIVSHTNFVMNRVKTSGVIMDDYGGFAFDMGPRKTAVSIAEEKKLLTEEDYKRVKNVLQYYKKYSSLTRTSGFAEHAVNEEEYSGRSR